MTPRSAALEMREKAAGLCDALATAFQHQHDNLGQSVGASKSLLRVSIDTCRELARDIRAIPLPDESEAPSSDAKRASNMLMECAEFFGSTLAQADERAWEHLLTYCPKEFYKLAARPAPGVDVMGLLERAAKALQPFANRVFYDNGDCTVSDTYRCTYDDFVRAKFALAAIAELQRRTK